MLTRSFKQYDQKRMGCAALICFFLMAFHFSTFFTPYIATFPLVDSEESTASRLKMLIMNSQEIVLQSYNIVESITPTIQNMSNSRSQVYEMNGDIRIHGNSSTIFIPSSQLLNTTSWTINPYARHFDRWVRRKVTNLTIIVQNPNTGPSCNRTFDTPAVVFSTRGYTGNPFHDFTDVLVPLYLTSRQFNSEVIFLVTGDNSWWTSKYRLILNMLSKYNIINIDNQNEVLCFPRMIVGLKSHKEFGMDQSMPPNYSMTDFTKFLRQTYSLDRGQIGGCKKESRRRPRLLIVSRKKTRHLTNEREVAKLAHSVGFDVVVREMGSEVLLVAKLVNSFDVMVAVHGAAITNMVFLPENAVVIQIVPCGLEVLSRSYFEIPSKGMKLRYLEYRVSMNESSLAEEYGIGNEVCRNPKSLHIREWHEFRSVYLDKQDVNVDLVRFRKVLLEAKKSVCS